MRLGCAGGGHQVVLLRGRWKVRRGGLGLLLLLLLWRRRLCRLLLLRMKLLCGR